MDGRYRLERMVGEGAAGAVWAANQIAVDRTVAVKILHRTAHPDFANLFETEAKAVARLNHRNCLILHDFGFDPGLDCCYMVTEFIDGELLAHRMTDHMDEALILRIGLQVAMALEHAHDQGVLHRDLKPENIILTRSEGQWDTPKVLDFGLARLIGDARTLGTAAPATVKKCVGTPMYMSPERWWGEEAIGPTDLYSLGVILYELLEGHPPFDGETLEEVRWKHLYEPLPPMQRGDVSPEVEALVVGMLAKSPEERPQRACEVVAQLERELQLRGPQAPEGGRARRPRRRSGQRRELPTTVLRDMPIPKEALPPSASRHRLDERLLVADGGEPGQGTACVDITAEAARRRRWIWAATAFVLLVAWVLLG